MGRSGEQPLSDIARVQLEPIQPGPEQPVTIGLSDWSWAWIGTWNRKRGKDWIGVGSVVEDCWYLLLDLQPPR